MKPANAIMFLLVGKQDIFKSLPYPFTGTFTPNGDIDVLDMIDTDQLCSQVVKLKACLDEVCPLIHVFCP